MEARRLEPDDRARLGMDTVENPMVVTAIVELDGQLEEDALLALFDARLLVQERFRSRIAPSGLLHRVPCWQPEPTEARHHLTHVKQVRHVRNVSPKKLPTSDTDLADDDDLANLISNVMSLPLDFSTSPWHAWLIDGPNNSTLVFRIHHALADGLSLVRLLFAFSDEGAASAASFFRSSSASPRSSIAQARRPSLSRVKEVRSRHPAATARAFAQLIARRADPKSSLSGLPSGKKRIAWTTTPIDVERIRHAAHAVDGHINDVLLGIFAGALQEYLASSSPQSKARTILHALVPVALDHDDDDEAQAHGQHRGPGNHFVSLCVPLPIGITSSPINRVRLARDEMREARAHHGEALGRTLVAGASFVGRHAERLAVRMLSRKASLVASNLAGPPWPLHLGGHLIRDVMFAAPAPGSIALSTNAFSYAGKLRVTIASDAAVIPDPDRIAGLIDTHAETTIAALLERAARSICR